MTSIAGISDPSGFKGEFNQVAAVIRGALMGEFGSRAREDIEPYII